MSADKAQKQIAQVGANVATSLAASGLGVVAGPAAGIVAKPVLNAIGSVVVDFMAGFRARRANAFAEAFMESGTPVETAAAELRTELERSPDEVKGAVVAAFRELEEALCDLVIPALGLLTRSYVRAGRGRDSFFVGAARLLRDVASAEEYAWLQRLVSFALDEWPGAPGNPKPVRVLSRVLGAAGPMLIWGDRSRGIEWDRAFDRPMHLLEANGLFARLPASNAYDNDTENAWEVEWVTCSNLHAILV